MADLDDDGDMDWSRRMTGGDQNTYRYSGDDVDCTKDMYAASDAETDFSPTTVMEEYEASGYLRTSRPVGATPAHQVGHPLGGGIAGASSTKAEGPEGQTSGAARSEQY